MADGSPRVRENAKVFRAFMTQSGHEVTLKIGTRQECQTAIDVVSGAPNITKIGMERWKGEKDA